MTGLDDCPRISSAWCLTMQVMGTVAVVETASREGRGSWKYLAPSSPSVLCKAVVECPHLALYNGKYLFVPLKLFPLH